VQGGGGNAETALGMIDTIFTALFNFHEQMNSVAYSHKSMIGTPDIKIIILSLVLYAISVFICSICAGVLLIGKMGVSIMLALAPLFVFCLITPWTTKYFDGWVTAVASFILFSVFGAVFTQLLYLGLSATSELVKTGWQDNVTFGITPIFVFLGVSLYMLKNIGDMVRSIVGGSGWQTPPIGGAIYDYANRKAGRPASNTIREKATTVTKAAYSRAARLTN
jgi:type IV secretion system protein VirB6